MKRSWLEGCISVYGPYKAYVERVELTEFEVNELLVKGVKGRCLKNFGDSEWIYYKSDNPEVKKISYRVNHMDDGWGAVCFRNESSYNLEIDVNITGQNLGKGKAFCFDSFQLFRRKGRMEVTPLRSRVVVVRLCSTKSQGCRV